MDDFWLKVVKFILMLAIYSFSSACATNGHREEVMLDIHS